MYDMDKDAKVLWEYMHLHHELKKVDVIIALGSSDLRVANRAAEIYQKGYAPLIICSGGYGKDTLYSQTEASAYQQVLIESGIPESSILLEEKSTNTGENIRYSRELLFTHSLKVSSVILVHKPYMERRTFATCRKQWPEIECIVTSPYGTYDEYTQGKNEFKARFINLMVGDLQRIKIYPAQGFHIPQTIPDEVWQAGQRLVAHGYTKYVLPN